jgi:hypothetical protein
VGVAKCATSQQVGYALVALNACGHACAACFGFARTLFFSVLVSLNNNYFILIVPKQYLSENCEIQYLCNEANKAMDFALLGLQPYTITVI